MVMGSSYWLVVTFNGYTYTGHLRYLRSLINYTISALYDQLTNFLIVHGSLLNLAKDPSATLHPLSGMICRCTMLPGRATCIRIHICWRTHVAQYKLLVPDTCWLYLGDIITINLCHGRLVSLCIQQQTGDKLATILSSIQTRNMLTATSGYNLYPATSVLV